jgi:Cys-tRNA(Pro)/Cys-tRNA(Cys) deacylase
VKKTNAMRVLEAHKVEYETIVYDDAGEFHSADEAAHLIGSPLEAVYKTLVVLRETPRAKPMLVMIASDREIDLRVLAKSVGEKKLRIATKKEAEQLTGAPIGAISALAQLQRGFEMLIDRRAAELDLIHISAGVRGVDIQLCVDDLLRVTHAKLVDATKDKTGEIQVKDDMQGTQELGIPS